MFDLQVFAEEKREAPTPRKRMLARQRGQVFQSTDLVAALSLLTAVTAVRAVMPATWRELAALAEETWGSRPPLDPAMPDLGNLALRCCLLMGKGLGVVIGAMLLVGVGAAVAQTGAVFTVGLLAPKVERLNPFAGLQRLFSKRSLVEALKATLKVTIIGFVAFVSLRGEWGDLENLALVSPVEAAARVGALSAAMFSRTCLGLLLLGAADLGYQWWEHEMSLRMTRQELKEEIKETEGRPEVKARIRSIQRHLAM
ncbi:MAG: EscU/YscU/HrcU family type III secretion system export apparatus switch protein, partial [Firmicutes bacterium]|nr:EscU/YscU/HrcU family type III secretion system export apparatus switch protein [Bacillota bacterium]